MKLCFCKYFNKYLIHSKPIINDTKIPITNVPKLAIIIFHTEPFNNCNTTAPKTTGALKKKENLAALSRSSPSRRPAAIVVPEREKPGIKANT